MVHGNGTINTIPLHTVTSMDADAMLGESENIYENCAVVAAQAATTPVEDIESALYNEGTHDSRS